MQPTQMPASATPGRRGVIALATVLAANAVVLLWMIAPPSIVPYLGWYADLLGPAIAFGLLALALAVGWVSGYLPRRSPYVIAAGAVLVADLVLAVAGAVWLVMILGDLAEL
ncbi:hypothetical protein GCM10022237_18360 [Nocardioides ginsengisoli]